MTALMGRVVRGLRSFICLHRPAIGLYVLTFFATKLWRIREIADKLYLSDVRHMEKDIRCCASCHLQQLQSATFGLFQK